MVGRSLAVFVRCFALAPVFALASVLVLAAGGCGSSSDQGAPGTASCTIMQTVNLGGTIRSQQICEESTGLSAAQVQQFMQQCTSGALGGGPDAGPTQVVTFGARPCSRENALGGCRVVQGGATVTGWYYQMGTFTSADIQQLCALSGATFVAP